MSFVIKLFAFIASLVRGACWPGVRASDSKSRGCVFELSVQVVSFSRTH